MTRMLLAGLTLCVAASASVSGQATTRWLVVKSGEPTISIDTTTFTKSPDAHPRAWVRFQYTTARSMTTRESRPIQYTQELWRADFDCIGRRFRIVADVAYDAKGANVENYTSASEVFAPWQEAVPDTEGEWAVREFCKRFSAR